jgi:hypothetical protein
MSSTSSTSSGEKSNKKYKKQRPKKKKVQALSAKLHGGGNAALVKQQKKAAAPAARAHGALLIGKYHEVNKRLSTLKAKPQSGEVAKEVAAAEAELVALGGIEAYQVSPLSVAWLGSYSLLASLPELASNISPSSSTGGFSPG